MWSEPIRTNDLTKWGGLKYPLIATPIGSGMRYVTDDRGIPRDITGSTMANDYVREQIEEYGMDGVDGHIQVKGGKCPADAVFTLDKKDGEIEFEYFVQDMSGTGKVYAERSDLASVLPAPRPDWMILADPVTVYDDEGAENYWQEVSNVGFAGIYLRKGTLKYMEGGVSLSLMAHIEYAKWIGGEATAVGFEGTNGRLDYITCQEYDGVHQFKVAHGFRDKQRTDIWRDRSVYTNFVVRYQHQDLEAAAPVYPRFKKISKR
jgi:hypothetical protein